jgi:hypothetical protein
VILIKKLILAYPGTGARELSRLLHALHLDIIGSFVNPNDYWSWELDLHRFGILWAQSKIKKFVGYGLNWKGLIDIAGPEQVTVYRIPMDLYEQRVKKFRQSKQYETIDLPMIKKKLKEDYEVSQYVKWYMEFIVLAETYITTQERFLNESEIQSKE